VYVNFFLKYLFVILLPSVAIASVQTKEITNEDRRETIFFNLEPIRNQLLSFNLAHGLTAKPVRMVVNYDNMACGSQYCCFDWKIDLIIPGSVKTISGNYASHDSKGFFAVVYEPQ
jgi:hypothetical protein